MEQAEIDGFLGLVILQDSAFRIDHLDELYNRCIKELTFEYEKIQEMKKEIFKVDYNNQNEMIQIIEFTKQLFDKLKNIERTELAINEYAEKIIEKENKLHQNLRKLSDKIESIRTVSNQINYRFPNELLEDKQIDSSVFEPHKHSTKRKRNTTHNEEEISVGDKSKKLHYDTLEHQILFDY